MPSYLPGNLASVLWLFCVISALPAQAALLAVDPLETGQIEFNILPSVPPSVFPTYAHNQPLERVDLVSILDPNPPNPISGVSNHTSGYLIFDLAALAFSPLHAAVQVDVRAEGLTLEDLQITSIDTISAEALSALPTGSLAPVDGNALRMDISLDGDVLGTHGLSTGSQGFNIELNPLGLLEVAGAGNGLLALGIAYEYDGGPPDQNARVWFDAAPRLLLSDAPIILPAPGALGLLLLALGGLACFRRGIYTL